MGPSPTGCKDLTKGELLTGSEKTWLGQQIIEKRATAKFLSEMFSLPTTALYSYVKRIKNGNLLRQNHGAPPILDDQSIAELRDELITSQRAMNCRKRANLSALVLEKAKESSLRSGGNGLVRKVSSSTLYHLRKKANVSFVSPQSTTHARLNAVMDIRIFYESLLT